MSIEVKNISKRYESFRALREINLHIATGELIALLGPSGSGKTTLLRLIAGLEQADEGEIYFYDEDYTHRPVQDRQVGFVFQHYALFRHMNIFDNVAFGLQVKPRKLRPHKKEIAERVHELLKLVQLEGFANRFPSQLSGGQRQRVALARALAVQPRVLLLDEPFGALDLKVRQELRRWLRELHHQLQITTVFVTHDQEEALELADRVVIMNHAEIQQIGSPDEVYQKPANPFVYRFLGRTNLFALDERGGKLYLENIELRLPEGSAQRASRPIAYIRPHELELHAQPVSGERFASQIHDVLVLGNVVRLFLNRMNHLEIFEVELERDHYHSLQCRTGDTVYLSIKKVRFFP